MYWVTGHFLSYRVSILIRCRTWSGENYLLYAFPCSPLQQIKIINPGLFKTSYRKRIPLIFPPPRPLSDSHRNEWNKATNTLRCLFTRCTPALTNTELLFAPSLGGTWTCAGCQGWQWITQRLIPGDATAWCLRCSTSKNES